MTKGDSFVQQDEEKHEQQLRLLESQIQKLCNIAKSTSKEGEERRSMLSKRSQYAKRSLSPHNNGGDRFRFLGHKDEPLIHGGGTGGVAGSSMSPNNNRSKQRESKGISMGRGATALSNTSNNGILHAAMHDGA